MSNLFELIENQIAVLSELLDLKKAELRMLNLDKYNIEAENYPLSKFVGQDYIYDKPYKWNSAETNLRTLTEDKVMHFKYLKFNGLFLGSELNTMYDVFYTDVFEKFSNDSKYVTFVIPDEDYEDSSVYVPLENIGEILAIKLK